MLSHPRIRRSAPPRGRRVTAPSTRGRRATALTTLALTSLVLLGSTSSAAADTWAVTTPLDSGFGSLRYAVASASDGDVIVISSILSNATIELQDQIDVTRDVTITGEDAPGVVVDANQTGRVFLVEEGCEAVISHLGITGGRFEGGGAIYNRGHLTLRHCSIYGNESVDGWAGGAINNAAYYSRARLVVENCTISHNESSGSGGGIASITYGPGLAEVEIRASSITMNDAAYGGGILSLAQFGGVSRLNVVDSVISWNTAAGWGGGIRADRFSSDPHSLSEVTLATSDINGNHAGGRGGGIANAYGGARITLTGCGVISNTADEGAPNFAHQSRSALIAFLGYNWIGDTSGLIDPPSMDTDHLNMTAAAGAGDVPAGAPPAVVALAEAAAARAAATVAAATDADADDTAVAAARAATTPLPGPAHHAPALRLPPRGADHGGADEEIAGRGASLAGAPHAADPAHSDVPRAARVTLLVTDPGDAGPGTLRETLDAAADGDEIRFHPDLAGQTITLESTLSIDGHVTVDAADAPGLVLDAGGGTTHFWIQEGARVILANLTLKNGLGDQGGAIHSEGYVTLRNCRLLDNHASSRGGAIAVTSTDVGRPARLVLEGCELRDNSSDIDGGAIAALALYSGIVHLEIRESTIAENSGSRGAGVWVYSQYGGVATALLADSELTGNQGWYSGAGLRLHKEGSGRVVWASVVRCQVTGNSTGNSGGGIAALTPGAWLELRGTTVLNNQAASTGPDLRQGEDTPPLIFAGENLVGTIAGVQTYARTASDLLGSATSVTDDPSVRPGAVAAAPARVSVYPNPFNPRTQIEFALPRTGPATLEILDVRGRVVARPWQGTVQAGEPEQVRWSGQDLTGQPAASGVYVFRVVGPGGETATGRATLVR